MPRDFCGVTMRRCLDCRMLIGRGSRCPGCAARYRVPTDWANAVKRRDGYRCVICGSPLNVEAHHIRARQDGGTHTLENGRTLCQRHHRQLHQEVRA
jgi:hypothetical protein